MMAISRWLQFAKPCNNYAIHKGLLMWQSGNISMPENLHCERFHASSSYSSNKCFTFFYFFKSFTHTAPRMATFPWLRITNLGNFGKYSGCFKFRTNSRWPPCAKFRKYYFRLFFKRYARQYCDSRWSLCHCFIMLSKSILICLKSTSQKAYFSNIFRIFFEYFLNIFWILLEFFLHKKEFFQHMHMTHFWWALVFRDPSTFGWVL